MTYWLVGIMFMLGASLTSFAHLVAVRIPNHQSILGRSYCDHCQKTLRLIDVFPIIGYILNKGRCHYCQKSISICYPIIEVMGGLLLSLTYLIYGWSWDMIILSLGFFVLLIETISDIHHRIVIDRIWMIGWILLLFIRLYQNTLLIYLFSSLLLFSILFLVASIGQKIYKKEVFGGGDVKLYLFIGMLLPYDQALASLFFAAVLGLIYGIIKKRKQLIIPFVPFIMMGTLLSYLYGESILAFYLQLLGV
jgi:leader peptidase (prepilin peptidase)/N-methyltransferase